MEEQFEKALNKKFESFIPQMNEDALWGDIEKKLENKKDRNGFVFYISGAGILGLVLLGYLFTNPSQQDGVAQQTETQILNQTTVNTSEKEDATPLVNTQKLFDNSVDANISVSSDINEKSENSKATNLTKELSIVKSDAINTVNIGRDYELQTTSKSGAHTVNTNKGISDNQLTSKISQHEITNKPRSHENMMSPQGLDSRDYFIEFVRTIPLVNLNLEQDDNIVEVTEKSSPWLLTFNAGAGLVNSRYDNQSSDQQLLALRQNIEDDHEIYSANVGLRFQLHKNWQIGFGINYYQAITGSVIDNITEEEITLQDTVSIIHSLQGSSIVLGDRQFISMTQDRHLRYNRFNQLSLPIQLTYTTPLSSVWEYELGLGYALPIYTSTTGYDQDPNNLAYNLGDDTEGRLNNNGSHRLLINSGFSRRFENSMRLHFGLRYSHDLTGIYDNFSIQKNLDFIQINTGILVPLNF